MKIMKFQEGGAMAPVAPAPTPAEQDPMMELANMAMAALEGQDCGLAMQVCEGFVMMLGGGQPPVGAAPEGQPIFKKGGKMAGRCKKKSVVSKHQYGGPVGYGVLKSYAAQPTFSSTLPGARVAAYNAEATKNPSPMVMDPALEVKHQVYNGYAPMAPAAKTAAKQVFVEKVLPTKPEYIAQQARMALPDRIVESTSTIAGPQRGIVMANINPYANGGEDSLAILNRRNKYARKAMRRDALDGRINSAMSDGQWNRARRLKERYINKYEK